MCIRISCKCLDLNFLIRLSFRVKESCLYLRDSKNFDPIMFNQNRVSLTDDIILQKSCWGYCTLFIKVVSYTVNLFL